MTRDDVNPGYGVAPSADRRWGAWLVPWAGRQARSAGERLAAILAFRNSLSFKIIALPLLIFVAWLLITMVMMIFDARERIDVEVKSSGNLARALVESALPEIDAQGDATKMLAELAHRLPHARHVQFIVASSWQDAVLSRTFAGDKGPVSAPNWFVDLIAPPEKLSGIKISAAGSTLGYVLVAPNPSDEIDEVWNDFRMLAIIFGSAFLANVLAISWLFAHMLKPLRAVADGLEDLERGDLEIALPMAKTLELSPIVERFNRLASSLARSVEENRTLHRQVAALRENERKRIAHELHDELGPCLFSIRAEAARLVDLVAEDASIGDQIRERAEAISERVDAVQKINRNLLDDLRPVALSERGLTAALHDLVDGWQDRNPKTHFSLEIEERAVDGLDETTELAIYRIVQECATNIARHANADFAEATIRRIAAPLASGPTTEAVQVVVRDNGKGVSDPASQGLGILGIRARARELGGSMILSSPTDGGLAVEVFIPVEGSRK